jgi:uncharacterized protein (UPF0248 family)
LYSDLLVWDEKENKFDYPMNIQQRVEEKPLTEEEVTEEKQTIEEFLEKDDNVINQAENQ